MGSGSRRAAGGRPGAPAGGTGARRRAGHRRRTGRRAGRAVRARLPAQRGPDRGPGLVRSRLRGPAPRRRQRGRRRAGLRYRARGQRVPAQGRGEHPGHAQHDRLHAVLLLPGVAARSLAQLVQELRLPLTRGPRTARRCWPSSGCCSRRTPRSWCGTRAPRTATWSCPPARRGRTPWPRRNSPPWSPGTG